MSAQTMTQTRATVRTGTMQAIVHDRYGDTDVLRLEEIPVPAVGDGEVLVRIYAAGVEPGVWHLMTGLPYLTRLGYGLRRPKVRGRGRAVAGTVDAVGANVTRFTPGDAVYGWCDGAFAEYTTTAERNLVAKPAALSFVEAAAVPISGETALQAVRDVARVRAGQTVLVTGAAGGVGSFAVQIAKSMGATVTGVTRTSKLDLVRSLGADQVIDYTREELTAGRRRFEVIIDTAGNRPLSQIRRALTPTGTLVVVGGEGAGGRLLGGFGRNLIAPLLSRFTRQDLRMLIAAERSEDLLALNELIESGHVTPRIDRTFLLQDTGDAIRYLHAGQARGKVVVTV